MRKLAGIVLACIAIIIFLRQFSPPQIALPLPSPSPSVQRNIQPLPQGMIRVTLPYHDQMVTILIQPIAKTATIVLIPNFSEKKSAEEIAKQFNCTIATNGGFYQKNGTPLGLFMTQGKVYGQQIPSSLVTGFFGLDKEGKRFLTKDAPDELSSMDFIFQSGPLFFLPRTTAVNTIDDKASRRMLLAQDNKENLFALVIYDEENLFLGPALADIALLISSPEVQKIAPLTKVINLDGGSASFFSVSNGDKNFTLSELIPVGSLLCIR